MGRGSLRRATLAAGLLWASPLLWAQSITRPRALADLDTLRRILESNAAYLAVNSYNYRGHLDSIGRSLPDSLGLLDFHYAIQSLVGRLQDAHSNVVAPPGVTPSDPRELPFATAIHAGRVVALGGADSGLLVTHYPYVTAINGIAIERLLTIAGARYRGHSRQRYLFRASRDLRQIALVLTRAGAAVGESLAVRLTNAQGRDTTVFKRLVTRQPPRPAITTTTTMLADSIAYLRVPLMWDKDDPGGAVHYDMMRAAMESRDFRTSRALIIDVRDNDGGARHELEYLAPYFMKGPLAYNAAFPVRDTAELGLRSLTLPNDPRLDSATRRVAMAFAQSFRPAWSPTGVPFLDQLYVAVLADRETPHDYSTRPVVVLMDERSFSATDIFLGAMTELPNVTLLGTPSGGGSGRSRAYTLPNSRIRVILSTMASFRVNGKLYDGYGIEPDIVAPPSLSDVTGRTDSQLQAAMDHIRKVLRSARPN
ncbi:MAG TPA: S41 family peptidase [Gemmatimonadaceae bacterium]|nr:S41 family peptidase [Gemmatimonadaceae bacterium]